MKENRQYTKEDIEKVKTRLTYLQDERNYKLDDSGNEYNDSEDGYITLIEELKTRAINDDICALYALGGCGIWCLDEVAFNPLTTNGLIGDYLFSMSDNDNAICLTSVFKYGIIVPSDHHMSKLLGRAKNITVVETDDDGNTYGYVDTDVFKIDFTDKEKAYITSQIQKIADTIPELRRNALYCLTDIYTYYFTSQADKQKKMDLFLQIYREFHDEDLPELILNCVPDEDEETLIKIQSELRNIKAEWDSH